MRRSPLSLAAAFVCLVLLVSAVTALAQPAIFVPDKGKRNVPFAFSTRERGLMRAHVLERNQRTDEALAVYESLRVDSPNDREVFDAYVDALLRLKRTSEAQRTLADWLRTHPDSAEANKRMAETYAAARNPALALEYYERAMRIAESGGRRLDPDVLEGLGYALWSLERTTEALLRFNELAAIRPNDAGVSRAIRDLCRQRRTQYVSRWSPYSTDDLCPKTSFWGLGSSDDQPSVVSRYESATTVEPEQSVPTP